MHAREQRKSRLNLSLIITYNFDQIQPCLSQIHVCWSYHAFWSPTPVLALAGRGGRYLVYYTQLGGPVLMATCDSSCGKALGRVTTLTNADISDSLQRSITSAQDSFIWCHE